MTCDEFETRILSYPENQVSADERAAAEDHLAGCASCHALVRQLQQLDEALTIKIKARGLSADFNQRLAKRIQAETRVLSEAQRAERKRQLQSEYETDLAKLNRRFLSLRALLAGMRYAVPMAGAGCLAWLLLPQLSRLSTASFLNGVGQSAMLTAAGAVFLAIALTAAFPPLFRKFWSAI